ncbi:hypothetical protein [Mycobacterium kyogaense]|uniref:hypothetical protein n=1 Tax=Mycobacterium kyogaense TaxID=2212479 RepID=UPI0013C3F171|nr:hypothetical protein [Mycobacterium kyogaense]
MNEGRQRRKMKQARRDARRRHRTDPKLDEHDRMAGNLIGEALAKKHPLGLLAIVAYLIQSSKPDPFARLRSSRALDRERLIENFTALETQESTALLAALAEFLDDDPAAQTACRQEVARRRHHIPKWITELRRVEVYRAVRFAHVLGDFDELVIGARFPSGHEVACVAQISHSTMSMIDTAEVGYGPVSDVLDSIQMDGDPDVDLIEMTVADAKEWMLQGLKGSPFPRETEPWPQCRPLVEWLVSCMPDGGDGYAPPDWDHTDLLELQREFFASPAGKAFDGWSRCVQMENLLDSGNGDPLRWSAARIAEALDGSAYFDDYSILEIALSTPDLLRAYIPFAHARSGVREGLTAEALAAVDRHAPRFRREVIAEAKKWGYFDDDDACEQARSG